MPRNGTSRSPKRARIVLARCSLALEAVRLYMRGEGVDYREARTVLRAARRAVPELDFEARRRRLPVGGSYSLEYEQLKWLLGNAENALSADNFHTGEPELPTGMTHERRELRAVIALVRRATEELADRIADAH